MPTTICQCRWKTLYYNSLLIISINALIVIALFLQTLHTSLSRLQPVKKLLPFTYAENWIRNNKHVII